MKALVIVGAILATPASAITWESCTIQLAEVLKQTDGDGPVEKLMGLASEISGEENAAAVGVNAEKMDDVVIDLVDAIADYCESLRAPQ